MMHLQDSTPLERRPAAHSNSESPVLLAAVICSVSSMHQHSLAALTAFKNSYIADAVLQAG